MNLEADFRALTHKIAEGLTAENVSMIRFLCRDAVQHSMTFKNGLNFFEYFETKGWINPTDMTFLAEVLYRINRHDLLKKLPGVKNRKDYELNFLNSQSAQNFSPFRIACFQLIDELTSSDFMILKNFCRNKLSKRNYEKSVDVISLLVCLEEEDYLCDGDLDFILSCLRHLDNQIPYSTFQRLSEGDFSIVLPKIHQSPFHHSQSMPSCHKGSHHFVSSKSDSNLPTSSSFYPHYSNFAGGEKIFVGLPPSPNVPNDENRTFTEEQPQKMHTSSTSSSLYRPIDATYLPIDQTRPHEIGLFQPSDDTVIKDITPRLHSYSTDNSSNLTTDFKAMKLEEIQPSFVDLPEKTVKTVSGKQPQHDGLSHYSMASFPTGLCLVINNCDFQSYTDNCDTCFNQESSQVYFKNRTGSEKDVFKVENLFQSFGFKVQVCKDLKAYEVKEKLSEFANLSHELYDCFVLVVMSHGGKGLIYGVDKIPIYLAEIKKYFKPESCPTLIGKPKIFFVQACQTDSSFAQANTPSADLEIDGFGSSSSPEADFLICYSTVPGYPSYRSRSNGSFYICCMVKNLAKHHKTQDVLSIMVQVNNEMADLGIGQIAMPIATLRKKIYFKCTDLTLLSSVLS